MEKLDFKKEYRDLYIPGQKPALITVPAIRYIMVNGTGAPEGESYQGAISILYSLCFSIKMSKMNGTQPQGYFDYVMPPLEGLWSNISEPRENWRWTSMIRQPDFVTDEVFARACEQVRKKKPELDMGRASLKEYNEGMCVQAMHIGPFSAEQATMERLLAFMEESSLVNDCGKERRHHEIYLSDFRKTAPERMKTVLRLPVRKNSDATQAR